MDIQRKKEKRKTHSHTHETKRNVQPLLFLVKKVFYFFGNFLSGSLPSAGRFCPVFGPPLPLAPLAGDG
jgi:hypothetical protein